ncbi:PhaM family polyhydroxyalkanoate granule multifunctional regulatory protein [Janthinobacterium sp. UMAB-60]|uniref:PhaM family polyhydroxyalkanoate granule multifunctional regulatory protein n=1 Tax=Janthinobacterium sp. UMAB-60 TaxID=1365365 RepID=UPI001C576E98|nr:PhaM family polyhydroxyalkanoate granule multifunctional regulatory protein [Janthinobacterium sp. UMAB-60]
MANPQMPHIPGAAVVTDTLDFVKNLWGSMSVPGMGMPGITAPTMSVEELDKKISDLKAVEAWLNLNTSMLRGSIQALEVQRGTIATLKSMGASLAAAITQPGASEKTVFESVPYASAFFQQAAPAAPAPKPAPAPAPAPAPEPAAAAPDDAGNQAAAQLANPSAWWNLLQDQFKQAVSTAMSPDAASAAAASFGSVSKAKPAASKPAKPAEAGTAAKAKAPLRKAPAKRAAPKAKAPGKA